MPILTLSGGDALETRKNNPVATWGFRDSENRVEPLAKPDFDVPFRFRPGERIFTIGSCFARNVEGELLNRGFKVPMRDLFKTPAFEGLGVEIVNNFGTPSIYNELAWAFGEEEYDEDDILVELNTGRFIDLQMINSLRPASLDLVRARRSGLAEATRAITDCRVVIMTLGLVELWWDSQAERYLNTGPLPSVLRRWPERFELHVLNYAECYNYLSRALDIIFKHGGKDLQVILTVSPVPMMATHRPTDVITANCYSKSVLRAAAEQAVARYSRVSYFPSYESVTLSDRRIAWTEDMVHVTREIVAFNVERMLNAFAGKKDNSSEELLASQSLESESPEALMLAEKAREAREAEDEAFFEAHAEWSTRSPAFAREHARFLLEREQYEAALALIEGDSGTAAALLRGRICFAAGDHAAAIEAVQRLCRPGNKGFDQWKILLDATAALGNVDAVMEVERRWTELRRSNPRQILYRVGLALKQMGAFAEAAERFHKAMELGMDSPLVAIECARSELKMGSASAALRTLEGLAPQTPAQEREIERLRKAAGDALKAA